MTAGPALCAESVRVHASTSAGELALVDGVDLTIDACSVTGVVGETGAGKTMTMRALLQLLPAGVAGSGRIRMGDGEWMDLSATAQREVLRRSGVVFQHPPAMFDPLVRMGRQLVEGLVLHDVPRQTATARARELLARLGFNDPDRVLRLYPHQLSGGMIQRVAIAMALMTRPKVLFVDEPTSALDAHVRHEVLELLRELTISEQAATFLISHDLFSVSRYCDVIVVMYGGRIVEQGPADAVLREPEHPYTRGLVACSPTIDAQSRARLAAIAGAPPTPGQWPAGCVYAPRCPMAVDRCRAERPALRHGQGRAAACHFAALGQEEA